jgi:uncharacterized protein (DUF488 family)
MDDLPATNMLSSIHTIGHSTRALDEFLELLHLNAIERLVDIRRYPGSRRFPHFGSGALERSLRGAGIAYEHYPDLGGRRSFSEGSSNQGWRNDAFRAYADHMSTPEFRTAIDRLLASESSTVIMCAEAVPWRCHRNLVSDELVRRNVAVHHIIDGTGPSDHKLNPMARIVGDHLTYPSDEQLLL